MPKTSDFTPLWPSKEYAAPMPENAGDLGGQKGGSTIGSNSDKETGDKFGPKVTTVELGGISPNDKVTPEKYDGITTTTVRKPTRGGMKG